MPKSRLLVVLALASFAAVGAVVLVTDDARDKLVRGQELMASADYRAAAAVLSSVEGDPVQSMTVLEARLLEVRAVHLGGDATAAAELARKVVEVLPADHAGRGRAEAVLADAFDTLGRHDDSARLFGAQAKAVLGEGQRSRVAGYYLTLAKRLETGEKAADPLKPGTPPDFGRAAELYGRALGVLTGGKPLASVSLPYGRCLLEAKRAAEAVRVLSELLDLEKVAELPFAVATEARFRLAAAELAAGQPASARSTLEKLLAAPSAAESPFYADAQRMKGDALLGMGGIERLREAVATWRRYLELHPDHADAPKVRASIADALFGAGLDEEAIAAYRVLAEDAKAEKVARAGALFRIAAAERRLQRFDAARESLRHYLSVCPDDHRAPEGQALLPELLLEKARVLRAAKDEAGAISAMKAYVEEYPLAAGASDVAVEIGLVLRETKAFDEAIKAFAAARDRYREAAPEAAARAGLQVAVIEEEDRRDLEKAASGYQAVVADFGSTQAAGIARQRIAALEAVELSLAVPRMYVPGEPATVALAVRNVPKATFRIYRLNAREYFERRGTLDGAADIEIALVKSDRSFVFETPDYRRYRKDEVPVPITLDEKAPLGAGAYLVAVEAEERRSVVLVLVSSIRVVVKESPYEVFCWAVDAKSGEPKEGVELLVRGPELQTKITSGKDGVARLAHDKPRGRCEVLAVLGADVAPGLAAEPAAPGKDTLAPRVAVTLDRPLYRPGSEIRFQLVVRGVEKGSFVTPEKAMVRCRLLDPRGRTLGARELETGAFGATSGAFLLPAEGAVGEHRLVFDCVGTSFTETVRVEEYEKPEYEVTVRPKQNVVRPGDEVGAAVSVAYYFGGPVRQAPFEWRVYKAAHTVDTTRYLGHAWYLRAVQATAKEEIRPSMELVASGAGSLDSKGEAEILFRSAVEPDPVRYVVQVFVRDTTGQWIAGQGTAYAGPADRFAVVLAEKKTLRSGDALEVRVVTADLGYRPLATRGRLSALLERRAPTGGGTASLDAKAEAAVETGIDGEAKLRLELAEAGSYLLRFDGQDRSGAPVVAETRIVVTGEKRDLAKEAELRFEREVCKGGETVRMHLSVPEASKPVLLTFEGERVLGYRILRPEKRSDVYAIEIGEDLAPNVVVAAAVPGADRLLTAEDRLVVLRYLEVSVAPGTDRARPGDEVQVSVKTRDQLGREVPAAVAMRMIDGALADLAGKAAEDPRYVFNRDIRPHLVRTGSSFAFRFAGTTVFLDPDLVALARQEAKRAQEERLKEQNLGLLSELGAAKQAGEPAAGDALAEREKAGADAKPGEARSNSRRALRSVGGGGRGAPAESAPAPRPSAAPAAPPAGGLPGGGGGGPGSGPGYKGGDAGLPELRAKERERLVRRGTGLAEDTKFKDSDRAFGLAVGDPASTEALVDPVLRENFVDVAGFWPMIVTGEDGSASVKVKLPDNLTTWEFLANGATRGTSVGQARAELLSRKDVILRVDPPRFLTSRDQVVVPAVAHSNLEEALAFRLRLGSKDAEVLTASGAQEASFDLDAGGVARRDFGFAAKASGAGVLEGELRSTKASDALRVGLPIVPFGEPWSFVRAQEVVDRAVFTFALPHRPVPGSERYRVLVQAGFDGDVLDGLGYLVGYPHACLEQSIHRWLPAMLLAEARARAGRPPLVDAAKLRQEVEAGLLSLQSFLNDDGGFGYWPKGSSEPFATALALEAIAWARRLGYATGTELFAAAVNGATALLARGGVEADARAALALALTRAEATSDAALNALSRERSSLSNAGLARLLLAVLEAGRSGMVAALADELRGRQQKDPVPFKGRGPGTWHSSDLEATALALQAFVKAGASASEMAPLVAAVRAGLRLRNGGTKAVAAGLEALSTWIATEGALASSTRIAVKLDGKEVAAGTIDRSGPLLSLEIPVAAVGEGDHRVEIEKQGGEAVVCRLVLANVRPAEAVAAAGTLFEVTRRVIPFQDPDKKVEAFAPGFEIVKPDRRPRAEPPAGLDQAVLGTKVTVELEIKANDSAGYVVIEDALFAGLSPIETGVRGGFDRFERRDARLVFYKNRFAKGEKLRVTYPCYVVHAGRFAALPARVEEMYAPERNGRSASALLHVVPDASALAQVTPKPPTADELYRRGLAAFGENRYEEAVTALAPLPAAFDLVDDAHERILGTLLRSYLRLDRAKDAVKTLEELRARAYGRETLNPEDTERLGRAYLAVGDGMQARFWFQDVVLGGFATEVEVAEVYRTLGLEAASVARLEETLWRYPAVGDVVTRWRGLADWYLELADPDAKESAKLLAKVHRARWRDALSTWLSLMAWNPKSAVAEDAGYRRIEVLDELGLMEPLVQETAKFVARNPESDRVPLASLRRAKALFGLDRFDLAAEEATRTRAFGEKPDANGQRRPNPCRDDAAYLLGKVAHVKGDYAEAVKWYGSARERVPDAQQSYAFFTMKELSVESVIRADPAAPVKLAFDTKNLAEVKAQVYPVDLSVLFAVKKSFQRLSTAELSGIAPADEVPVTTAAKPYQLARVEAALGKRAKGAYLVVLRAEDKTASTLLLVTEASLRVQRESGSVRVYLVDGQGKPIPAASVKIGLNGRIVHSGATDERGLLDLRDPGQGLLTVVAEKGDVVAVATQP